jgi:glycosyltransferase involved in cell wall biosynthesis
MKITALIPAYNVEKFIERSINSALRQTYKPMEILIVDDGSTDRTAEIAKSYGEKVTYLYKENGGSSSAKNFGIRNAKYDWIAFLDSDDEWMDTHLENFVNVISQKPDLMWYGAPIKHIDEANDKVLFSYKMKWDKNLINNLYFRDYLSALPPVGFFSSPTMIIHKKVFDKTGLFDTNKKTGEDINMWFRIGLYYPEIGYCGKISVNVYKRNGSLSQTKKWNPEQSLNRFRDCEELAKKMGEEYIKRAEPRIIYWVKKLLRTAISRSDINAIRKVKAVYFNRLPPKYKFIVTLVTLFPFSIRIIKVLK